MKLRQAAIAPPEWPLTRISDICSTFTSGGTPSRKRPDYFAKPGIPWVKTGELLDCALEDTDEHITEAAVAGSSAKILKKNTILMAMYGATVGQLGLLRREMACNQACAAMTIDESIANYRFLFYLLKLHREQIKSSAIGAAQQNLNGKSIKEYEFRLPPLKQQHAIAATLGALDEKIELNRKTAATLEAMARALYRSWFVDFDPVHSKAAGDSPVHMDAATAALFPDSFGDDGLPSGWSFERIGDHVNLSRGLSYKGSGLCDKSAGIPMHNLNSIYEGGGYKREGIKFYRGEYKKRHQISAGDLIVANTEQAFDLQLIGFAALTPSCFGPIGLFSQHLYKIDIKSGSPLSRKWLYYALNTSWIGIRIRSFSNGTTVNMLPQDAFEIPKIPVPSREVVAAFEGLVRPMIARQEELREEAETLAALRDALLPKLMSGELRVADVEHQVAEVV